MKPTTLVHLILAGIISATLVACSGSGASAPINTPISPGKFTQDGPLNPYVLATRLLAPVPAPLSASITPNERSTRPNGSAASTTAVVSGVIADTVPGAGIIFGPINVLVGAFANNAATAELQAQINTIDTTLASIQTQINSLQSQITADNALYTAMVKQQAGSNACSALQNWDITLQNIYVTAANTLATTTTCGSTAKNITTGIGNQFQGYINGKNVNNVAIDPKLMEKLSALASSSETTFQGFVTSASTTGVEHGLTTLPLGSSWNPAVYSYISRSNPTTASGCSTTSSSDATAAMLVCGYQYLVDTQLPTPGTQGSNVVATINNYNQLLDTMYQQDIIALQYAYTIEATSNYLNYVAYANCLGKSGTAIATCLASLTEIPSWEGAEAITFSVGTSSTQISPKTVNTIPLAQEYLTSAQQNLVAVYAARINALYKNILSFTISDNPLPTQSYAPPPAPITMANGTTISFAPQNTMYATIQAETLKSPVGVNTPSIPGTLLNSYSGGLFYQYNNINQVWTCLKPSTTQTLTNPTGPAPTIDLLSCASAFPNSSNSYYDGVTMSAYAASASAAGGVVPTPSLNTNTYCSQTAPTGPNAPTTNSPIVWKTQLMCSVWGGTQFVNSTAFPGNANFPSAVGGYLTYPTNYEDISSPGEDYYIQVSSKSLSQIFLEIGSSEGASPGFLWGQTGNFQYYSASPWGINDGGFPSGKTTSEGQAHVALLQVTLPNGYIFPFYLMTASFNAATTGTDLVVLGALVCTAPMQGQWYGGSATPPGVASCAQNNNSTGGLTVGTSDGSGYTVKFWSSDSIEVTAS